jgi:PHP family Zn ribbon phosphoesterase
MAPGLRLFRVDLHIHTALSPCASDDMAPPAIVATALARGLDMIAICDHNTAGNVGAVQEAARAANATRTGAAASARGASAHAALAANPSGEPLAVLAGIEFTSAEEVHVVGLFPDLAAAESAAAQIRATLPAADADYYAFFGEQPLLAVDGHPVGAETAALALGTALDLTAVVELIHSSGGLAIAAHVDRTSFSVFSQLGFFPADAGLDAVEVSRHLSPASPRLQELGALGLPITSSSDSHFLEEIGTAATKFWLQHVTFAELALAFAGIEGRTVARA